MKPSKCKGCSEFHRGYGFVNRMQWDKKIRLVIAEPERSDINKGKLLTPFSRAGSVWNEVVRKLGYDWSMFG